MKKRKLDLTVELTDRQLEYLERMVAAHELKDVSKALRVLVSYAMANPGEEAAIFDVVRCSNPTVCEDGREAAGNG